MLKTKTPTRGLTEGHRMVNKEVANEGVPKRDPPCKNRQRKNPGKLSVQFKKVRKDGPEAGVKGGVLEALEVENAREVLDSIASGWRSLRPWDSSLQDSVYNQWKNLSGLMFYVPRATHECTPGVCGRIWVRCSAYEEPSTDAEAPPAARACFGSEVCGCRGNPSFHPGFRVEGVDGFSVCTLSGKPHFCGAACEHMRAVPVAGGGVPLVCPVTGLEEKEAPAVNVFWRPEGWDGSQQPPPEPQWGGFLEYALSNASKMNYGTEGYKSSVAVMFPKVSRVPRPSSHEWKSSAFSRTNKERYLKIAIEKFSGRMSPRHWEAQAQAAEALERRAAAVVEKYAAKCERNRLPLVASHVREIVQGVRGKRARVFPMLEAGPVKKNSSIVAYAQMAVRFWAVLRERTVAGRCYPGRIPFFFFVDAYIDILSEGLLAGNALGEKEVVVPRDSLIAELPFFPDERDRKNQKKAAEVKRVVVDIVDEAVREGVDPFRLSVASMDFEAVSESMLEPLKIPPYWSRRKRPETRSIRAPAETYTQKLRSVMLEYDVKKKSVTG